MLCRVRVNVVVELASQRCIVERVIANLYERTERTVRLDPAETLNI